MCKKFLKNNAYLLHRKKITTGLVELAAVMATNKVSKKRQKLFQISYKKTLKLNQWFRQTKTLIWATVLVANFPDAEAVGALPVYLATTTKTWLAAPTEAIFFQCS
jgi:hypothetical protein